MTDLNGASALVLGATGGLGMALSSKLHERGATLTLAGRNQQRLDALPVPGARHVADLRSPEACNGAMRTALDHAGALDIVVNAVGVVAFGPISELSTDVMEELFLTNTFIPIMVAKAALDTMAGPGVIVNISGVIAEQNLAGMAAYGASKAATQSFDQALAREARRSKIRVIDARPPHTETGLADRPIEGSAPNMPVGLDPQDVAATICDAIEQGAADLPSSSFS